MPKDKADWWIEKKLRSGVTRDQLRNSVGAFSNRKKEVVMREKGLSEKQYRERWNFLAWVYSKL